MERIQSSTLAIKTGTLYAACSPEWGVVCYGSCLDKALNNLADEIYALGVSREQEDDGQIQ
jgi:hypothetical protein